MAATALVLGGGGITGIGWEIGMLAGLAEAGVDLTGADLVVGTSAGSIVGAQLTSGLLTLGELYERQLADSKGEIAARLGPAVLSAFVWHALRARDARAYGVRLGRAALAARTPPESEQREVIAQRLVSHDWPGRRLIVTAVDSGSGEFSAFEAASGVGIVDAVAASCAVPLVWPPVTIGDKRWIDGGIRSSANADLAAGYERVVVLAPILMGGGPIASARSQADALTRNGSRVALLSPDRAARAAFGRNVLDPARRAPAARAGFAQAAAHAQEVASVWAS
ncbi:patatin-like phospholipase family protein [Streptomyces sp. H27-D2]|uniref:patatin-like phospholipase family protein n=1 Tax=Streptomyces sp. H27-D2 TaxID=3046304 RepID=UPI002DBAEC78|nr:patatin-like phospholipase family protein [Streptomyces sp. H27-D2]MEC4021140.1 patatin-like phospholipase family protein [Streptomyces sp. H27-D2]